MNTTARWDALVSNVTVDLNAIHFVNHDTGFVVGDSGTILKTIDGGATWNPQSSATTEELNDVHFRNASRGYIVGNNGVVLTTTNGGGTWTAIAVSPAVNLFGVHFASAQVGTITGENGIIFHTSNGGSNWTQTTQIVVNIVDGVHFPGSSKGYACGSDSTFLKSSDGGSSWTDVNTSGMPNEFLSDVFFTTLDTGFVVGNNGTISMTTNGGNSWTSLSTPTSDWIRSIDCPNKDFCVAVGVNSLIVQKLASNAWQKIPTNETASLNDVKLVDNYTGYACGNAGSIIKSCPVLSIKWDPSPAQTDPGVPITLTFINDSHNYTTWQWKFSETDSTTVVSPSRTFPDTGLYEVELCITNETGCTLCQNKPIVIGLPVAIISNEKDLDFNVYPNPFSDELIIETPLAATRAMTIRISDLMGRQLYIHQAKPGERVRIDGSKLPAGMYIVDLITDQARVSKKMVRQ
ncbi:MAG: T9SS type A sorting domain-containing protein [Bacteroidetes bacterium]|nr:T9SS type A sorting domain-containing protein [Bacteroidota bacterium]